MSERQEALRRTADQIATAAVDVRTWIDDVRDNSSSVRTQAKSLIEESRRVESLARTMSRAVGRRVAVGIFGASQSGKSFLASVLARAEGAAEVRAKFGSLTKHFLTDIDPGGGGKESTGLVTRFTMAASALPRDDEFPVELQLLSEADVVKILANSFQIDFDQENIDTSKMRVLSEDEIRVRVANCRAGDREVAGHLGEIEVFGIAEYFRENFRRPWERLERLGYWEKLIDVSRFLPPPARADMFSVLWGGLDAFTSLYKMLAGELERLGHAKEARTVISALLPKTESIIDVARLDRLQNVAVERDLLTIRVLAQSGGRMTHEIERVRLAAIVAELRMTLADVPRHGFEDTDILDFPGARSRDKITSFGEAQQAQQMPKLYLRAKLAYLFQRYAEERELNALLVCMVSDRPHEVKDLGPFVTRWIEATQRRTGDERSLSKASLFIILTMADRALNPQLGDTDEQISGKWDARVQSLLREPFGSEGWLDNFAEGLPFRNVVLLRNPGVRQTNVVEYHEGSRELVEARLSSGNRAYIDKMRESFLNSAGVGRYFEAPEEAWEAMLELNDGGARYVRGKLGQVCNQTFKDDQVGNLLLQTPKRLRDNLKAFYHSAAAKKRHEAEQSIGELRQSFVKSFASSYRLFPRLLSHLMLCEQDIRDIVLDVGARKLDASNSQSRNQPEDIFGPPVAAEVEQGECSRDDHAAALAKTLCENWIAQLRLLKQNERLLAHYGIRGRDLGEIIESLIVTADRLKLADAIADSVRSATQLAALRWSEIADRIASIASHRHNGFVAELGFGDKPIAERPGWPEGAANPLRSVFEPAPALSEGDLPTLGREPEKLAQRAITDWGIGFRQVTLDNLSHEGGRELSASQNTALGALLERLSLERAP